MRAAGLNVAWLGAKGDPWTDMPLDLTPTAGARRERAPAVSGCCAGWDRRYTHSRTTPYQQRSPGHCQEPRASLCLSFRVGRRGAVLACGLAAADGTQLAHRAQALRSISASPAPERMPRGEPGGYRLAAVRSNA